MIDRYNTIISKMFSKTQFKPTPERINFAKEEEATLKYWEKIDAFNKQLEATKHLPPFTFYDGPPFATGTPHYGHIAAGTIKDVVCRYAVQTGHSVSRRFGWDCHGLPVEYEIDKELKITNKKQVIEMGIANYNQECRNIVMRYSGLWEDIVNRFGRWIDFRNDYKTMDLSFMESVWHVFKCLFDRGLVYRGRRIMPYSNACNTVLSNFEVQQNYKEVDDPSIHVTFPLKSDPTVKFVAWTTTPWTLPSNLALAVHPDFVYAKVRDPKRNEVFILAECRLKDFFGKEKFEVLEKVKGSELAGVEYVPLFEFFHERAKDGCFRVQTATFVTDSDGTGIVHCAPGFGEDDYKLCVEKQIISPDNPPVPLDENGRFTKQVSTYEGLYVKDADKVIMEDLKQQGRLIKKNVFKHNYPFCWRSDTPLIYKAVSTWFIRVSQMRANLVENNNKAYWVPRVIQEKKFDNWLKDAKDWCFSRNRFWGNPIPLWVSEDGEEIVCVGSLKELEELTGAKVADLHREHIDHLTIESKRGKGKLRRIEEVFDCWFESGSMPFAQVHYPFSTNEEEFAKIFPADFIGQGIDQTRGWFYTLNVVSTGIKNSHPYKNLIVNGLVLNKDGKKMSKRLKNYPDPMDVCNEFGADAIRLYLINSPLVRADNLNFSEEGVRGVVRDVFLPWYNAYRFLIQNISKWESHAGRNFQFNEDIAALAPRFNITDRWIESALQELLRGVRRQMGEYKLYNVLPEVLRFLEQLTNWYVRLNRARLKGEADEEGWEVSLNVLFDVLLKVNVLLCPLVPFLTEHIYQNLRLVIRNDSPLQADSTHLLFISEVNPGLLDPHVTRQMQNFMGIVETARKLREQKKVSLKQPVSALVLVNRDPKIFEELAPFLSYIREEVNVEEIRNETSVETYVRLEALPNLPVLGPKFKGNKAFADVKASIAKLTTAELEKVRETGRAEIAGQSLEASDLLIQEKFVTDNLKPDEAIGGDRLIVLLDTRQSEELKIRGFAREIVTRVQKLKKRAHLKAEDPVLIFYRFGANAKYLSAAVDVERKTIVSAVKKPFLSFEEHFGLVDIAHDQGTIDEEEYHLKLSAPGPIFNFPALKESFGDLGANLAKSFLELPYEKSKQLNQILIKYQNKDYTLIKNKHYSFPI